MKKIEQLLYRKEMAEAQMDKYLRGFKVHSALCDAITEKRKSAKLDPYLRAELEVQYDENMHRAKSFSFLFKSVLREYKSILLPQVEKEASEAEKKGIVFQDYKIRAEQAAANEIWGKATILPANIEHVDEIESIKKQLNLLMDINNALPVKIAEEKDPYQLAVLNKQAYDTEIHIQTLTKRLRAREEYYYNTFLPVFKVELKEAKEKVSAYYMRGLKMAEAGLDIQLQFVLREYEQHRNDDQKLWLYYTALKARIEGIREEIMKDPKRFKQVLHLSREI